MPASRRMYNRRPRSATSAPAPVTCFDSFNRAGPAMGIADSGEVWVNVFGTHQIAGGGAEVTAGAQALCVLDCPAAGPNAYAQARIAVLGNYQGLAVRGIDSNNVYMCRCGSVATGVIGIWKIVAGVFTYLAASAAVPAAGDTWKFEIKAGGVLNLYQNGILRATAIDASLGVSNRHGFQGFFGGVSQRWDDLELGQA